MTRPVMMAPVMRIKSKSSKKTQPSVLFIKKITSQVEIPVPEKLPRMDRATQVEVQPSTTPSHGKLVHGILDSCRVQWQTSLKKNIVVTTTIRTQREGETGVKIISK